MSYTTVEALPNEHPTAGHVKVTVCERNEGWADIGEALMMAEALLKMFRHDHQAGLVKQLREWAIRASLARRTDSDG